MLIENVKPTVPFLQLGSPLFICFELNVIFLISSSGGQRYRSSHCSLGLAVRKAIT